MPNFVFTKVLKFYNRNSRNLFKGKKMLLTQAHGPVFRLLETF